MVSLLPLACFKVLSLSLSFDSLIVMCLSASLFVFFILGIPWAFCVCITLSFLNFWTFSAIIISNKILCPFVSLFSSLDFYHVYICLFDCVTLRSVYFYSLFFSFCCSKYIISNDLSPSVLTFFFCLFESTVEPFW